MSTPQPGEHPAYPPLFAQLHASRELNEVYAFAYGYLISALDGWARGRLPDAELANDFHVLQREVASASERIMSPHQATLDRLEEKYGALTTHDIDTCLGLANKHRKAVFLGPDDQAPDIKP